MKKYILSLVFAALAFAASAQDSNFIITYQMSLPVGETNDYISAFSGRGVGMEWRQHLASAPLSFGLSLDWNVLYQKTDDTYTNPGEGIVANGRQYRYMNIVPILAHANYYFNKDGIINPYLGVGVGTYYINQRTEFGQWAIVEKNWHFGVAPELGILADVNPSVDMIFSVRYNMAFKAGNSTDHSYLGFNIGFVY
ncbi:MULTISPECIES: outer membrane beta-barrel protein [Flammeovirga]|uniref:Outer membrane beta-barrel protein n=1 Tax=Flammeovirga agarivorans TaxID=2726742 RepID=A0A7X8XX75_9BACT|nr:MULTISPECIES: outer membrane beta-barrel protein [Flammeovirga]NLR92825.1 outer membrane beta-barrel protein [Flammeovirga agarivorans]